MFHLYNLWKHPMTYAGLAKKKKFGPWLPLTFFCIKVRGYEILKIGEK